MRRKRTLVICEPKEAYAQRLLSYMEEQKSIDLEVHVFTEVLCFKEFIGQEKVDMALVAEELLEDIRPQLKGCFVVAFSESLMVYEREKIPCIYKFQSAEQIFRRLCELYVEEIKEEEPILFTKPDGCKLIGVFSPKGGTGKTTFAATLGQCFAETKKVLVVNLEAFSGLNSWCGMKNGLSELLYHMQNRKHDFDLQLQSVVQKVGNFEYLAGVGNYNDLQMLKVEQMEQLLEGLRGQSKYDVVILDMSFLNPSLLHVLDECDLIYEPILQGQKRCSWVSQLTQEAENNLEEKCRRIVLPRIEQVEAGIYYLEQSAVGTLARELVREES